MDYKLRCNYTTCHASQLLTRISLCLNILNTSITPIHFQFNFNFTKCPSIHGHKVKTMDFQNVAKFPCKTSEIKTLVDVTTIRKQSLLLKNRHFAFLIFARSTKDHGRMRLIPGAGSSPGLGYKKQVHNYHVKLHNHHFSFLNTLQLGKIIHVHHYI